MGPMSCIPSIPPPETPRVLARSRTPHSRREFGGKISPTIWFSGWNLGFREFQVINSDMDLYWCCKELVLYLEVVHTYVITRTECWGMPDPPDAIPMSKRVEVLACIVRNQHFRSSAAHLESPRALTSYQRTPSHVFYIVVYPYGASLPLMGPLHTKNPIFRTIFQM